MPMHLYLLRLLSLLVLLTLPVRGYAMEFQFDTNHCTAREYSVTTPHSGDSGMLLGTSAWAEGGVCLRFPIAPLRKAATDLNVMTWTGVTRILRVQPLALAGPDEIMHVVIEYDARHQHLFVCQSGQWPMEWTETVERGTGPLAGRTQIVAERVPGGNSNGGYIKHWSVRIALQPVSATETSFHMRYEVTAPGQSAAWARDAIKQYVERLTTVAAGGRARGATVDPDCPY